MIPSLEEYEIFIYSLQQNYKEIKASTLVFKRTSSYSAQVVGWLYFGKDIKLRVVETIDFIGSAIIDYGYEVWLGDEKLYWYDCWPHPDIPELAESHPHHKHIHPDIKHHRISAKNLNFTNPNLPFIIQEIIDNYFEN